MLPVVANTALTLLLWWRFEESDQKYWSWLLVLSQVWPQYKAFKVIRMLWTGHKLQNKDLIQKAERAKQNLQRGITTLEPFVESVPQVLILCNIWLKTSVIGTSINKAEVIEDIKVLAGSTRWIFYGTFSISVFTASLGETTFKQVKQQFY